VVEAAGKYGRVVQAGTQGRSTTALRSVMEFLHSGKLGKLYMARIVCYVPRESIGASRNTAIPAGVNYDLWLGPAAYQPFNETRFHYNWHWFRNTGNGETGNNGPHLTDLARWALQKYEYPRRIQSMGGYDVFQSMQETPNTHLSMMEYSDGSRVQLEVRGLCTNAEPGITKGMIVFGSEGWMQIKFTAQASWQTYFGRKNEPGPKGESTGVKLSDESEHFAKLRGCDPHAQRRESERRHSRRSPFDLDVSPLQHRLSRRATGRVRFGNRDIPGRSRGRRHV